MKCMNNTPDWLDHLLSWLSSAKEQAAAAGLAGTVAILRGMYNGGGWKKTLLDGVL